MNAKSKQAINKATATHNAKTSSKTAKVAKTNSLVSHQWKQVKQAGVDKALGHGGVYCLRSSDVTENLLGATAKGAQRRLVSIFQGARGICFLDGAFAGKVLNVSGHGIDTGKIKRVLYFGALDGAIKYVKSKGKAGKGATKAGEGFTHYLSNDQHYGIATDGKRLLRLEDYACSGNAERYVWTLGK